MKTLSFPPCLAAFILALPAMLSARTLIETGSPAEGSAVSARFHREFAASAVQSGERLIISLCAADGAVIYVNGREIERLNMPKGPIEARTLALTPLDAHRRDLFVRVPVPPETLKTAGQNVIEVDVHTATAAGARPSFDLALKTLPAAPAATPPSADAKRVLETFLQTSYLAPGTLIPDGYFDGGRRMQLDAQDHASSHREILLVDRPHDAELTRELAYARTLRALPPLDRAKQLSLYVDQALSPRGGTPLLKPTMDELEHEYANKPLRIGDVCEQYHAGVCRHRSLLFKVLGDEAGLKTALVRGTYMHLHAGGGGAHAWNEVQLEDGRRFLVDTTLHPKDPFPEITTPQVTSAETAKRYVKEGGAPFYTAAR